MKCGVKELINQSNKENKEKVNTKKRRKPFSSLLPICAAAMLTLSNCALFAPKNTPKNNIEHLKEKVENLEKKVNELKERIFESNERVYEIRRGIDKWCDFNEEELKKEKEKGDDANPQKIKLLEERIKACLAFYQNIVNAKYGIYYIPSLEDAQKLTKQKTNEIVTENIQKLKNTVRLVECSIEQCVQTNQPNTIFLQYGDKKIMLTFEELNNINSIYSKLNKMFEDLKSMVWRSLADTYQFVMGPARVDKIVEEEFKKQIDEMIKELKESMKKEIPLIQSK
ncbi:MAG: hypothetical protein QXY64_01730 [Candidatus Bilamarchaeaceae archaeon]